MSNLGTRLAIYVGAWYPDEQPEYVGRWFTVKGEKLMMTMEIYFFLCATQVVTLILVA